MFLFRIIGFAKIRRPLPGMGVSTFIKCITSPILKKNKNTTVMKQVHQLLLSASVLLTVLVFSSFSTVSHNDAEVRDICVKVRGNGSSLVEVRVGPTNSSGACCRGVSKDATVTICGKEGYNVYDSNTKRLLFTLSSALEGETIDLRGR